MRPTDNCHRTLSSAKFVKVKLKAKCIMLDNKIKIGDRKYIVEGIIPEDTNGLLGLSLVNTKNLTEGLILKTHKNTKIEFYIKAVR